MDRGLRNESASYLATMAAVALLTALLWLVAELSDVADLSMVYLLPVLGSAIWLGRGPAIAASLLAFVAFNFFFYEPRYTLHVSQSGAWISLGLLLASGLVVAQLAADQRARAQEARGREREAMVLYDVVRLLGEPELETALKSVADRLRDALDLSAVTIEVGVEGGKVARGTAGDQSQPAPGQNEALAGELLAQAPNVGSSPRWVRVVRSTRGRRAQRVMVVPVRSGGEPIGSLTLVRDDRAARPSAVDDRLLLAVSSQLAVSVERLRLRLEATAAEVHKQADVAKTALLNAASHDLRTPLASIVASAGSLLQEDVAWTRDERREFASAIEQEAIRLNRIVSNLLDVSRIEAGMIRPDRGWYDIGALIENVVGRLRPLASQHHVVVKVADDLPPVPLDYVQIDQVLSNLLENALRHTPAGTEVRIDVVAEGGEMVIEVTDNGPGLPAHVLNSFSASRADGRPAPRGTRFGLSVVRGMIVAHGGRLIVKNLEGGGASFQVRLSLTARTGVRPPASAAAP